jgi:hypothetical protein
MRDSPRLKTLLAFDPTPQGAIAEAYQRDRTDADSGNRSGSPYRSTCNDWISGGEKGDSPCDLFGAVHAQLSLVVSD